MGHGEEPSERARRLAADREAAELRAEVARLEAENARLFRLLELTPREAALPGPAQAGWFEAPPGAVHAGSPVEAKVAFYGEMFAARTDAGDAPPLAVGAHAPAWHGRRLTIPVRRSSPCASARAAP